MLIYADGKKLMTYIFPERKKIDKAQFIFDRSGLLLKHFSVYQFSLLLEAFSVYHSRKLRMRTPFIQRILKF